MDDLEQMKEHRRLKVLKEYPQYHQGVYTERKPRISKKPNRFIEYQDKIFKKETHPPPNIGKIHNVIYDKEKRTLKITYEKND